MSLLLAAAPAMTTLGVVHTAISLLAVGAGIGAFVQHREISPGTPVGKFYIVATILTCLTGFPIMQHGGFGEAHALGVLTLIVLGIAAIAGRGRGFGHASRYVEAVAYSATFFFHFIPATVETTTRLPVGAPLVASRQAPELQAVVGGLFLLFFIGAVLQVRRMRRQAAVPASLGTPLPSSAGQITQNP